MNFRKAESPAPAAYAANSPLATASADRRISVSLMRHRCCPPVVILNFRLKCLEVLRLMSMLIDEKREEIAEACQRYGIERLFIFGSALREDFRPGESDIDLLVEFGPIDISKKFHIYLEARSAFSKILQTEVDLVMSGAVKNKVIAGEIDRTKKLFYGA